VVDPAKLALRQRLATQLLTAKVLPRVADRRVARCQSGESTAIRDHADRGATATAVGLSEMHLVFERDGRFVFRLES